MAVWIVLEGTFRFHEHEEELRERHSEEFIDYIFEQVNGTMELTYDCFMDVKIDFDIDRYLYLREMAQYMLKEGELEEVGAYLSEAHKWFQADPDLELMRRAPICQANTISNKESNWSCTSVVFLLYVRTV